MSDDDIIYERPLMHSADKPLLYRADGMPLKRQIGFVMVQTSKTFPELAGGGGKKKGGKKKC